MKSTITKTDNQKGKNLGSKNVILILTATGVLIALLGFLFGNGILNKSADKPVINDNTPSEVLNNESNILSETTEPILTDREYPTYAEHPNVPDFGVIRGFVLDEVPDEIKPSDNTDFPSTMYLYAPKTGQNIEHELQQYADILSAFGFQHEGADTKVLAETIDFENITDDTTLMLSFILEKYNNLRGDIVLFGYASTIYAGGLDTKERLVVLVQDTTFRED